MAIGFGYITTLALADSVNPCAIAVLALVLVAILTANPKNRKAVLFAGLSFILAVYILYIIYGMIFINLFRNFVNQIEAARPFLYKGLGFVAMVLGVLNIKDFFHYKAGGFATEMPIFMRPKVKKLIARITSPAGAFFIGIFVTLFLLPCTIGPYIIASGLLSELGIIRALLWLLYYNVLFILPMLIITLLIYSSFTTIERVSGWKEKNIRYLHLISGLILFVIGLLIAIGVIV